MDTRYRRAMSLLRDALRGLLAALLLLLPKKVGAQSIEGTARGSRVFAPLSLPTCALAVAVVCGALMQANAPAAIKLDHATITSPFAADEGERDRERQYEQICENERRRGNDCPSREKVYEDLGLCSNGNPKPDCTKQK